MSRARKNDHIEYALKETTIQGIFEDVHIIYDSLPEINFSELDTKMQLFGKDFEYPILINAMTGGSDEGMDINKALAAAAAFFNIPMAVGSQSIAIRDKSQVSSFNIVREVNPDGFLFANVSAGTSLEDAKYAIKMIDADGLQIHLNSLQELVMKEGDRNFKGMLENIKVLIENVGVPVMVKEVGFGLTGKTALKLIETNLGAIDIGGYGGTNFARIEYLRRIDEMCRDFDTIGIPTAVSLYDVCRANRGIHIICGGGIRSGLDVAKSIIMGAEGASIAFPFLKAYSSGGDKGVFEEIERILYELKVAMIAAGAQSLRTLKGKKVVITGKTLEWIKGMQEFN